VRKKCVSSAVLCFLVLRSCDVVKKPPDAIYWQTMPEDGFYVGFSTGRYEYACEGWIKYEQTFFSATVATVVVPLVVLVKYGSKGTGFC